MWIKKKTLKLRHRIVKLITPSLFKEVTPEFPRPAIIAIKETLSKGLIGVEIGVAIGINAESILATLDIKKLYLVDPYEVYLENGKLGVFSKAQAEKRLKHFGNKIQFITLDSDNAVTAVPNDLDFVCIDGNHEYEHIKNDIQNYYPKVREGGIIGGHDFNEASFGVLRAVLEFAKAGNLNLQAKKGDWWVQK